MNKAPSIISLILGIALFGVAAGVGLVWPIVPSKAHNWQLLNIGGHLPDLDFSLTNDKGQPVSASDYQGRVTLVYFGYTGCGDQCPTTLTHLSNILKQLGPDAEQAEILFISFDPTHDTPQVLHEYIKAFDKKHMEGLTGSPQELEKIAQHYRASYRASFTGGQPPHSNLIYVFDRAGHARLLITPQNTEDRIVTDLRKLIDDGA